MKIILGALPLAEGALREALAYDDGSVRAVFDLKSGQIARIVMTPAEARALAARLTAALVDVPALRAPAEPASERS